MLLLIDFLFLGASTTIVAAISPNLEKKGGLYLENCQVAPIV